MVGGLNDESSTLTESFSGTRCSIHITLVREFRDYQRLTLPSQTRDGTGHGGLEWQGPARMRCVHDFNTGMTCEALQGGCGRHGEDLVVYSEYYNGLHGPHGLRGTWLLNIGL